MFKYSLLRNVKTDYWTVWQYRLESHLHRHDLGSKLCIRSWGRRIRKKTKRIRPSRYFQGVEKTAKKEMFYLNHIL